MYNMEDTTNLNANKPLGPQLKQLRTNGKFTARALASQLGLKSHSTVIHLEDGRVPDPRISSLVNYLKALGYTEITIEL